MGSVIITVINQNKSFTIDMEVPLSTNADKLLDYITEIIYLAFPRYRIDRGADLRHIRTGRKICGNQTMEEFGLWNGDYIMITGGR